MNENKKSPPKSSVGRPALPLGTTGQQWVTHRPQGGYIAAVWVRTPRGKHKQVTASGQTKGAARRKLQSKLDKIVDTPFEGVQPTWTVTDLAAHWEEHKARAGHARRRVPLTAQTRWGYHSEIVRIITPAMGDLRLHELSIALLESLLADLEDTGLSTVRARSVLHAMLELAVRDGAIASNPTKYVAPPLREPKEVEALTIPMARHLLRVVSPEYRRKPGFRGPTRDLHDFCMVALGTGARISEILAVTHELVDLDSDHPTMTISGTMIEPRTGYIVRHHRQEATKNNQVRTLLLPDAVAEILRERRDGSRFTAPTDPVIASNQGTFMWASNIRERLRKAIADEPTLIGVTPHALRRTVASLIAYDAGLDAARLQLGHSLAGSTPLRSYVVHRQQVPDHRAILDWLFHDVEQS
ncbi:tyrosine-type recombinase/integrase [Nocardioides zhouii]|uniref:Tyr recombinase domain-containing protein n=1 Tax=Nocardioides zhouii TaxID=1168729 RepID=A0A4Q2SY47_9ACTN|nr:tyrosine-type recombinase/integrase [Nocardioides zhouii]RYC10553.1 hypothetical protein EUA94_12200 [Nocardioides zhouii]